jgi:hypothetical protein
MRHLPRHRPQSSRSRVRVIAIESDYPEPAELRLRLRGQEEPPSGADMFWCLLIAMGLAQLVMALAAQALRQSFVPAPWFANTSTSAGLLFGGASLTTALHLLKGRKLSLRAVLRTTVQLLGLVFVTALAIAGLQQLAAPSDVLPVLPPVMGPSPDLAPPPAPVSGNADLFGSCTLFDLFGLGLAEPC